MLDWISKHSPALIVLGGFFGAFLATFISFRVAWIDYQATVTAAMIMAGQ